MFKKYTPDDFDKHGYFKPPVGFYLLLVLLMRAYIIWIVSVANRKDGTVLIESLYPNKFDFFIGLAVGVVNFDCFIATPVKLIMLAYTPKSAVPIDYLLPFFHYNGRVDQLFPPCNQPINSWHH